mgnify:CR=1 FL=1
MAKKLTPKKIDEKVRKLGKEITKLKGLKDQLRKVDKLGNAVKRLEKKPGKAKKAHHRRRPKKKK